MHSNGNLCCSHRNNPEVTVTHPLYMTLKMAATAEALHSGRKKRPNSTFKLPY